LSANQPNNFRATWRLQIDAASPDCYICNDWPTMVGTRNLIFLPTERKGGHVQVQVRDNNVDQALRALKKKMQREGIFREMKLRNAYEKPSVRRAREKSEAVRRARKLARKRAQREGLLPSKRKSR
jgi:small subunit ribosomal protein S21